MAIDTLRDLLEHEIQDLYDAQTHLQNLRPRLVERITDTELREALEAHEDETGTQMQRLSRCAEILGIDGHGVKSHGMDGLLREARELVEDARSEAARDVALLMSVHKMEHYEIASFGAAATWAELLNLSEVASLLQECLGEAQAADTRLKEIARRHLNRRAAARA